ncbi:MAG: iron-sulfur cluster assembly scaffold protein [Anaerolineales bacterium]|nr:iron-sulfur cluster assembly scaffold protein [Anaerolineales bacterium]
MMDMYQENILDHAQHPRNWGLLEACHFHASDENPLCGDMLEVTLRVDENDIIVAVGWEGQGCAISQAAASMLGEEVIGKPLEIVKDYDKEAILELLGIPISMSRIKCALLSLKVIKAAAYNLENAASDHD